VLLRFVNQGQVTLDFEQYDRHPNAFEARGLPRKVSIAVGHYAEVKYAVRAPVRGEFEFGRVELRVRSPLGLWTRRLRRGATQRVKVYPDFAAIAGYALLATDNRLSQIGILRRRRRGTGMDFHQLREYREGDSQRQIDWKATSRMRKLISREYQDERDQQVVFLLDCGRRMMAQDDDLSHFDHALNAVLLVAYVALRQGDAAGFLTFASEEPRFLAPRKSGQTVSVFLNKLYDLQPTLLSPDYYQAALSLSLRVRKRALVIVVSNLRDEDEDSVRPALRLLARRHLVLFASLRERSLAETVAAPVENFDAALTHAATVRYLDERGLAHEKVRGLGTQILDAEPQELAPRLVNRYLEFKRAGAL
jgi:uncharacterized protein (DUF58 family)